MVDDLILGNVPAAAVLDARLVFPAEWPSRDLRAYLQPLLAEFVGQRRADEAGERWSYLMAVAAHGLLQSRRGSASRPYLRVADEQRGESSIVVAAGIRREVINAGDGSPLLSHGLCGGRAASFEAAAESLEQSYRVWATEADWRALPPGGGVLPSGPHYPGDCSTWT